MPRSLSIDPRGLALRLGAAALLLAVAGCSSGTPRAPRDAAASHPQVASFPTLATAVDEPLPIDRYLLRDDQLDRLERARATLVERCMKEFGFAYRMPRNDTGFRPKTRTQYRYWVTDASAARVHGYAPAGSDRGPRPSGPRPGTAIPRTMAQALTGTDDRTVKPGSEAAAGGQTVNGRTVPAGGCLGAANRKLKADGPEAGGDAPQADRINQRSLGLARRDPRVTAAFARWSRCMEVAGYPYDTPVEAAADPAWRTTEATARERAVATADARCKKRHNVVGIWYAVDVAYQKRDIGKHAGQLARIQRDISERQRLAAAVLDGGR
ncbi:hypothetical protein [Streptomyces aureocirculatus]|uniref:hypothetical protein n=1 Tax=Streptomyces aureocirculatus TaxID=67275 RepID=UPI00068A0A03|nr:hypothetical protein [Streptomyces aureocirculatus]